MIQFSISLVVFIILLVWLLCDWPLWHDVGGVSCVFLVFLSSFLIRFVLLFLSFSLSFSFLSQKAILMHVETLMDVIVVRIGDDVYPLLTILEFVRFIDKLILLQYTVNTDASLII